MDSELDAVKSKCSERFHENEKDITSIRETVAEIYYDFKHAFEARPLAELEQAEAARTMERHAAQIAELKASNAALQRRLDALEKNDVPLLFASLRDIKFRKHRADGDEDHEDSRPQKKPRKE